MKTALIYGAAMAIAGAVLTLLMYFAGFHDNAEKMAAARWVGMIGGIGIGVACLALAMREKRAGYSADQEWGYGPAFGGGVLTSLFASLFGLITAYLYFAILNPDFSEVILQTQISAMEARGMTQAQIDRAEPMLRKWMSPLAMTIMQGISGFVMSVVLALIVAIFFRKPLAGTEEAGEPPVAG
jgi:membrane associated rhomboid family serine protease